MRERRLAVVLGQGLGCTLSCYSVSLCVLAATCCLEAAVLLLWLWLWP